jgi:hypothetical protein
MLVSGHFLQRLDSLPCCLSFRKEGAPTKRSVTKRQATERIGHKTTKIRWGEEERNQYIKKLHLSSNIQKMQIFNEVFSVSFFITASMFSF